jgi:hypothetical protein
MFTTIGVSSTDTLDLYVKLKRFKTKADGTFTLAVFCEVDVNTKKVTGRFITIKMTEWTDPVEEEERKALKFEKVRSDVSLESISHKRSVSQKVLKPMSRMPIHRTMLQQIDEDDEQEDGRGGLFKSMILGNSQ